ncbi:MAG TPA: hypothetical protein VEF04_01405 [Blastocatellia bacterium]|nr:hypothetical protein [Blastocatellia bacterium]
MQTVGLLAAAIERRGLTTTSISLLREVTAIINPPRALFVPFPLGYPLGTPNNPILQHQVITASLELLNETNVPVLADFDSSAK